MSNEKKQEALMINRTLENLRNAGHFMEEQAERIAELEDDEQENLAAGLLALIEEEDSQAFVESLVEMAESLESGEPLDLGADRLREKEKSSRRRQATFHKGERRRDICEMHGVNYSEVRSSMRDGFSKRFRTSRKRDETKTKAVGNSQKNMPVRERRQMDSIRERSDSSDE